MENRLTLRKSRKSHAARHTGTNIANARRTDRRRRTNAPKIETITRTVTIVLTIGAR